MHDVDVLPSPVGVVLPGAPDIVVTWTECRRAIAGAHPESEDAQRLLKRWLQIRRWLADRPLDDIAERARPYGVWVESPLHPGLDWVRRRVLGDTLDLGFGFVGIDPTRPDVVVPVPHRLLHAAEIEPSPWWPNAIVYLERMGEMAAQRLELTLQLRPMGDCDVVTLLGSRTLRNAIVKPVPDGMRTVAIPMRNRGWLDLSRIDPAFSAAAARLTATDERGFDRPLLVTRDEVVIARDHGEVIRAAIQDPIANVVHIRDVLYHRN
jgi:hypothetical protein